MEEHCPVEIWKGEKACEWKKLVEFYDDIKTRRREKDGEEKVRWTFRGQGDNAWPLKSRLERTCDRFGEGLNSGTEFEERLLREFQRHYYRYSSAAPQEDELMEWLALMQHYGAPTRLLDWTYSFWVAMYFAVERAKDGDVCSIWAVDFDWWRDRAREKLPWSVRKLTKEDPNEKEPKTVNSILGSGRSLVYPLNPFHIHERLAVQQGVFLAPGDPTKPFMENMKALHQQGETPKHFIKLDICCKKDFLDGVLAELHRMNVNRATLFPGLEGFAQSLENRLRVPGGLAIHSGEGVAP